MNEAVPEAAGFDPDSHGGAADRDVLELGRHERKQAMGQRGFHDRLEGREPFHVQGGALGVDFDDAIEASKGDAGLPALCGGPVAEEVRDCALIQAWRALVPLQLGGEPPFLGGEIGGVETDAHGYRAGKGYFVERLTEMSLRPRALAQARTRSDVSRSAGACRPSSAYRKARLIG